MHSIKVHKANISGNQTAEPNLPQKDAIESVLMEGEFIAGAGQCATETNLKFNAVSLRSPVKRLAPKFWNCLQYTEIVSLIVAEFWSQSQYLGVNLEFLRKSRVLNLTLKCDFFLPRPKNFLLNLKTYAVIVICPVLYCCTVTCMLYYVHCTKCQCYFIEQTVHSVQ